MRLLLLSMVIAVALWFALPTYSVSAQENRTKPDLWVVRRTEKGSFVQRFDDGPNTCYVIDKNEYSHAEIAISCVVRK